ncbi:hypothetical protein J416_00364 [Gracilibacillus halophilus YIM-C55.5]|uniref:Uncharacterized protein n=1 Tax=Gracilibacillus halophilus YIM-C55.5 TaxID=1308866 RepID=N4WGL2_9BACI|nr:DUF6470 family protein [Gracilibacillus halophilus]ENH98394.1 hypothetical protein J416_00364 [Gracilibacillus halophilus YIM-C55.5]
MQMPQLRIQSQDAMIGLRTQNAKLDMNYDPAKQSIRQPKADMQIRTTPSKLTIDQSQAFADVGIKPTSQMIEEKAQEGKQKLMEVIARRRRQGDELMKIEKGGNPIKRQAKENGHDEKKQFNIGWIPSANSVKIDYQPAEVNVQVTPREPEINNQPTEVQYQYQRGNVETYVEQKNWLEIDFIESQSSGSHVSLNL